MGLPDPAHDSQFYAGVPLRRLVAFAVDVVVGLVLTFCALFVGMIVTILSMGLAAGPTFLIMVMTGFLYRWIMLVKRSATVGMILTGIEVRDAQGERMTPQSAFLHTAGYYATILFPPLMLIGWCLMATSPYRRTMHDLFIGAAVINRPV